MTRDVPVCDDRSMSSTLLDHPLITQRYFFPRDEAVEDPWLVDVGGACLACRLRAPHQGAPTLVHFHGNGEVVADYVPDVESQILDLGCNVLFVEYRGYGGSTGEPRLGQMLDDVDAVFASLHIPEEQAVAFGRSVGSMFALELVHRRPKIRGLILESGIADPLERLLLRVSPEELGVCQDDFAAALRERLDHRSKLAAYDGSLLVLHARHDGLVGVEHARKNYGFAAGSKKRLIIFEAGDHNSILSQNWDAYWEHVAAFVHNDLEAIK